MVDSFAFKEDEIGTVDQATNPFDAADVLVICNRKN